MKQEPVSKPPSHQNYERPIPKSSSNPLFTATQIKRPPEERVDVNDSKKRFAPGGDGPSSVMNTDGSHRHMTNSLPNHHKVEPKHSPRKELPTHPSRPSNPATSSSYPSSYHKIKPEPSSREHHQLNSHPLEIEKRHESLIPSQTSAYPTKGPSPYMGNPMKSIIPGRGVDKPLLREPESIREEPQTAQNSLASTAVNNELHKPPPVFDSKLSNDSSDNEMKPSVELTNSNSPDDKKGKKRDRSLESGEYSESSEQMSEREHKHKKHKKRKHKKEKSKHKEKSKDRDRERSKDRERHRERDRDNRDRDQQSTERTHGEYDRHPIEGGETQATKLKLKIKLGSSEITTSIPSDSVSRNSLLTSQSQEKLPKLKIESNNHDHLTWNNTTDSGNGSMGGMHGSANSWQGRDPSTAYPPSLRQPSMLNPHNLGPSRGHHPAPHAPPSHHAPYHSSSRPGKKY